MVEEQRVAGLEHGADEHARRGLLRRVGVRGPRRERAVACLHQLGEAAADDVETGRGVAAMRQRDPDVQRPDVDAHERAVLVPAARRALVTDTAQRGFLGEQHRGLAEVVACQLADAGVLERLHQVEQRGRGLHGEHRAAYRMACFGGR